MECIKADLSRELKTIEIHTFADLHLGDRHTDMDLIKSRIKEVQEKEKRILHTEWRFVK